MLYIDKSFFIERLFPQDNCIRTSHYIFLITRPQRFGKTLNLSMLRCFFDLDCRKEGAALFAGLKIQRRPDICQTWMNQYPVIFLSLKLMAANTYVDALRSFAEIAHNFIKDHPYLQESKAVSAKIRQYFTDLLFGRLPPEELRFFINLAARAHELPTHLRARFREDGASLLVSTHYWALTGMSTMPPSGRSKKARS